MATQGSVDDARASDGHSRDAVRRVLRGRWTAAALLALLLVALTFAMDDRAFLGTDTGGKVATLQGMVDRGDWRSDVGYWAAEHDPDGDLHPLYFTSPVGEQWVNATSLPMLVAARPLYDLGGYRLALLLPIAGTVAAALAARAIAERITPGSGPRTFWLLGLAGPLVIYAMDLWEHSLGVALVAWGVVLAMDARRHPPLVVGGAMGLLFGVAATMRTESMVFGAVIVAGTMLRTLREQRRPWGALWIGAGAAALFVVVNLVNAAAEVRLMDGAFRADRAGSAAGSFASNLGRRVEEAIATGVGLFPSLEAGLLMVGVALCAALVWLASADRDDRTVRMVAVVVGLFYVVRAADGLGFVPGMVAASPIAAVALVRSRGREAAAFPVVLVVASLPLVWLFQYTGGAVPQWGGRYLLPAMAVLTAVGSALLDDVRPVARRALVAAAVGVTVFGVVWTAQRTHHVADHGEQVVAAADGALISDVAFWLRELGAFYEPDRPWLTAQGADDRADAVEVLEAAGYDEFDLLHLASNEPPEVPGYRVAGSEGVGGLPGVPFQLTRYVPE